MWIRVSKAYQTSVGLVRRWLLCAYAVSVSSKGLLDVGRDNWHTTRQTYHTSDRENVFWTQRILQPTMFWWPQVNYYSANKNHASISFMTVMKHFFRDLSLFSCPGVLSHILAYSILLCNKGWITKLEEKEEILVVYFVGKAEGPEIPCLLQQWKLRAGRKMYTFNGLIPIQDLNACLLTPSSLLLWHFTVEELTTVWRQPIWLWPSWHNSFRAKELHKPVTT